MYYSLDNLQSIQVNLLRYCKVCEVKLLYTCRPAGLSIPEHHVSILYTFLYTFRPSGGCHKVFSTSYFSQLLKFGHFYKIQVEL